MTARIPSTMTAVLLTGHGGYDKLEYREDVPVPSVGPGQVLIEVGAAGVNNTDINTRIGWYSKAVRESTVDAEPVTETEAGDWTGTGLRFPIIQGADVCGRIVETGSGVDAGRIGERVLVATMQQAPEGTPPYTTVTLGSEFDGGFAQYVAVRASETHTVRSSWSDIELASIPCSYSTAENLVHRIGVGHGERVLVTGASGGVGTAAVQLAKRRGAVVIAVAGPAKRARVMDLGADSVVSRHDDLAAVLGDESIDVVVDVVGGPQWPRLLDVLRRGGRYIGAGAVAGPIVELDLRTLYLKDLTLRGATYQEPGVLERLVGYIERDEIRPVVHATYPLADIVRAQQDFLAKQFVGKLVLVPPPVDS